MKLRLFHIKYTAWSEGARIPVHGEFNLPAKSKEDAIQACRNRWPEINTVAGIDAFYAALIMEF